VATQQQQDQVVVIQQVPVIGQSGKGRHASAWQVVLTGQPLTNC
jgi:hypothetical protein